MHKFTPGGCRQDCGSSGVTVECPCQTLCDPGTARKEYDVQWMIPGGGPYPPGFSGSERLTYTSEQTGGCCVYEGSDTHDVCGVTCYAQLVICGATATIYLRAVADDAIKAYFDLATVLGSTDCSGTYSLVSGGAVAGCGNVPLATASAAGVGTAEPPCIETPYTIPANPNSCCPCEDCRVFRDPFNRSPGTDMGSNWDEVAGNWSLTAYGTARIESANALLLSTSAAPQVGVKLMTICRADASGDILRLVLSYEDADNYLFAEWKCSAGGYLRVYERNSGTNTLLDEVSVAVTANTFTALSACVNETGTSLTAVVSQGTSAPAFASGDLSATAAVGKYGLASGSTCSGASFGRVEMVKTSAGCEACASDCDLCTTSTPELVVDLGATPWVTDPNACCQLIYGEFTVAATPVAAIPSWVYGVSGASCDLWPVYDTCYWSYNDSSCNLWVIARIGTATTGLHWAVEVHVLIGTQTAHRKWVYSKRLDLLTTPLDCSVGWTVNTLCGGGIVGVGACVGGSASPPSSVTVSPP